MDSLTRSERSKRMSLIRSRGNKETELVLVRIFRQYEIRGWRRHLPIFGKPDFVFTKERIAVFVDGCFWHGCPKCGHIPKTRSRYWAQKILRNQKRDRLVTRTLRNEGWRVLRIWEHGLSQKDETRLLRRFRKLLGTTTTEL